MTSTVFKGILVKILKKKWHPWKYRDRIRVAAAVEKKKVEVSKTNLKPSTNRQKITSFNSQQKSRKEFPPLLGKFIDKGKAEPLHLKNNAWQQWNSFVLKYALSRTDVETVTQFLKCQQTAALVSAITASDLLFKQHAWQKQLDRGLPMTKPDQGQTIGISVYRE